MNGGRWIEPTYGAVYHGKADGDGGPVWVYQRLHTVHGPYVEVHAGSPDGELVRRVLAQHSLHAEALVQDLRDAMRRSGRDSIAGEVAPVGGRGRLDLHAGRARNISCAVSVDQVDPTIACARVWLTPGRHTVQSTIVAMTAIDHRVPMTVRSPRWVTAEIDVRAGETVVLFHSLWRDRLLPTVPRLHRPCWIRRGDGSSSDA